MTEQALPAMTAANHLDCTPIGLRALEGSRVRLVRSAPEYSEFIYNCYQDDSFMDLYRLAQNRALSKQEILHRLESEQTKLPQDLKRIEWVVLKIAGEQYTPIGLAALADYQPNHHRAEFLLGMLDTQHRKGLFSLEASLLVLDFAFHQVKLNKVITLVYGYNNYAQKNALHLGFKQEGYLEQHIHSGNREIGFVDLYQNGLLRSNFIKNKSLSRLSLRLLNKDITQSNQIKISAAPKSLIDQLNNQLKAVVKKEAKDRT